MGDFSYAGLFFCCLILLFLFQYKTVPRNYDAIYHRMTCQGARVLALGFKKIGEVAAKEV